jgi:hypothetical protein
MKTKNLQSTPAYLEAYSLLTFQVGFPIVLSQTCNNVFLNATVSNKLTDCLHQTALSNVTSIDTSRPTSGSSPSDGNETAAHPFSWDHQSQFYGDVHCYLYDVDNWDSTLYKRPRFMSEFGLQSWPSALTMAQVLPSDQVRTC